MSGMINAFVERGAGDGKLWRRVIAEAGQFRRGEGKYPHSPKLLDCETTKEL
jgi:hypothetical protein